MWLGLGWTHVKQGRAADARAAFARVLRVRRDNLSAKAGLQALE